MSGMDDEVLQMFIEESREHLASIESDLLAIEDAGENINEDLVNKVFRAAHSLKGGAGFLNLAKIKDLAHKIENVLDMIRSRELVPNAEIINILLLSFDKLRDMINNVHESNDADISEYVVSLTGLTTTYLPQDEKKSVEKTVDILLPDGKKIFEISEFDISHAVRKGLFIYLMEYDLMYDVHGNGKTPLDILNNLTMGGQILTSTVDLMSVGTLEEELPETLPFFILYATIIEEDLMSPSFELQPEKIHLVTINIDVPSEEKGKPSPAEAAHAGKEERVAAPEMQDTGTEKKPASQKGASTQTEGGKPPAAQTQVAETSLRVNVNLLETLMNLAGELVLSRNQLLEAISLSDQRMVKISGQRINLVTYELQEAIMLTRMQEIGNIFNKFPRVVRDLSRQLGKDVQLNISGKEVEMDKTIVEGLSDPLTHLIRNAVDHGVEMPDARTRAGKNQLGTINLKAYHEAGQVNIEISDDGKGIDHRKIAGLAVQKGLVSADKLSTMSEKEMLSLIMLPGFSTAENVTEISGRGVGMDVVKTNLDKLGGQIDIESELGLGTTFRIKLPLTLAIIPCLLVSVSNERFAVPQVNVEELIRISASQVKERIEMVGDAEVLILRGQLIPIIHLADILGIERTYVDPKDGTRKNDRRSRLADRRGKKTPIKETGRDQAANESLPGDMSTQMRGIDDRRYHAVSDLNIVVVTAGSFQYGLVVEDLHDTVEIVVKPLGKHVKHLREYAGATIMGDGRVALIIDVVGIAGVAQLNSLSGSLRAEELARDAARTRYQDTHSLLLFRNNEEEHCAVSLNSVERVERIVISDIESVGGKRVLQYRGESMPLFTLSDVADIRELPEQREYIVIVFTVAERSIGLLATSPVDTVELKVEIDQATLKQKGVAGSSIINGHTTLVIDVYDCVQTLHPEWFDRQRGPAVSSSVEVQASDTIILIAEDSDFFRNQVKKTIEDGGYRVIAAEDGKVAWDLMQELGDKVKLVVTDIEMPHMNGYQLTQNIKESSKYGHIPVIALSSLASDEDMAKGKAAGIDIYQVKLDKERLMEDIRRFLAPDEEDAAEGR